MPDERGEIVSRVDGRPKPPAGPPMRPLLAAMANDRLVWTVRASAGLLMSAWRTSGRNAGPDLRWGPSLLGLAGGLEQLDIRDQGQRLEDVGGPSRRRQPQVQLDLRTGLAHAEAGDPGHLDSPIREGA